MKDLVATEQGRDGEGHRDAGHENALATDEAGAWAVEKGVEMPDTGMPCLQMRSVAMR